MVPSWEYIATIELASDGQLAINMIQAKQYDCVVMDIRTAGLSGPALYRLIHEQYPDLARRIIFSTGDIANSDVRNFVGKIENPVLYKPFKMADLRLLVQALTTSR